MKNKRQLIFSILIFICAFGYSQNNNEEKKSDNDFWDHVQFGGGVNIGFGNNITNLGVSPSAIYNFSEKFSAGIGLSYLYSKNKLNNYSANVYGGSLIALYNPFKMVQLSSEFEQLQINYSEGFSNNDKSVPALYLGAAYHIGRNASIGLRFDVLYNENKSIYSSAFSPILRVFF